MKNSYGVAHRFVITIILILALSVGMQGMVFAKTAAATATPEKPVGNAEVTAVPEEEAEIATETEAPAIERSRTTGGTSCFWAATRVARSLMSARTR